jgi:hypothetical protein
MIHSPNPPVSWIDVGYVMFTELPPNTNEYGLAFSVRFNAELIKYG